MKNLVGTVKNKIEKNKYINNELPYLLMLKGGVLRIGIFKRLDFT